MGLFRGALGVANFFVSTSHARNYIPLIKFSAMPEAAKLEFFCNFRAKEGGWGVFRGALGVPISL